MFYDNDNVVNYCYSKYAEQLSYQLPELDKWCELYIHPEHKFYYDKKGKCIRSFYYYNSTKINIEKFEKYIKKEFKIERNLDIKKLYDTLLYYLKSINDNCLFGFDYPRYLCKVFATATYPERLRTEHKDNFVVIDNTLCYIVKQHPLNKTPPKYIPLTEKNFNYFVLDIPNCPDMSVVMKKKIIKALKKNAENIKSTQIQGIMINNSKYLYYNKNKFVLNQIPDEMEYGYQLPYIYQHGKYTFSDKTVSFLKDLFNDDVESFINFTKYLASAYICDSPVKKATVFLVNNNFCQNFKEFFTFFVDEWVHLTPYDYTDITFQDKTPFICNYNKRVKSYLILQDPEITNYGILKKLVKSTYQYITDPIAGKLMYKNTVPLVVITCNEIYAKNFASHIKSNIIKINSFNWAKRPEQNEFYRLHQALVCCGMKYISLTKDTNTTKSKIKQMSDNDIISKFVYEYCSNDINSVVSKKLLRDSFILFADTLYPEFSGNSASVCNYLTNLEYDGHHKKRLQPDTNPVAIFRGLYFNKLKFDADMKKYNLVKMVLQDKKELSGFDKILEEINSITNIS